MKRINVKGNEPPPTEKRLNLPIYTYIAFFGWF